MTNPDKVILRVRREVDESCLPIDSQILANQQLDTAESVLAATNGEQLQILCRLTASNTVALVSHIVASADQAAKVENAALVQAEKVEQAARAQAAKVEEALAAAALKLSQHIDQPFSRVGSEALPMLAGAGKLATVVMFIRMLTPWRWPLALVFFSPFFGSIIRTIITTYHNL